MPFPFLRKASAAGSRSWTRGYKPIRSRPCRPMLERLEERCLLSAGDLDSTFGRRVIDFGRADRDEAADVAIQADGKIVAVGASEYFRVGIGSFPVVALTRVNSDGNLDLGFGNGGKATSPEIGLRSAASGVVIQADGKIVVSGSVLASSTSTTGYDFAVARYNPDGSPDTSFGTAGSVAIDFGGGSEGSAGIALQPDGKILVVGATDAAGENRVDFAVARLNGGGSLDTTFGTGGRVVTDVTGVIEYANSVVLQPDGKIVVAGSFTFNDFLLVRYNSDGSLDSTFGSAGRVTTDFAGRGDGTSAVVLQPDGKILAAGVSAPVFPAPGSSDFALARYNSDGSLDTTFGTTGRVTTDFGSSRRDVTLSIALQPEGKFVAAGWSAPAPPTTGRVDFALARYNSDGSLDTSFGTGGQVITDFPSTAVFSDEKVSGVALQPDGKIVAAGSACPAGFPASCDFALARYDGDPPPRAYVLLGSDAGQAGLVRILAAGAPHVERFRFTPFPAAFLGGVRLATGDFTGDGFPDLVVASGPGMVAEVRLYDGASPGLVPSLLSSGVPYPGFTGGLFVAGGDITGDGIADLVIAPDAGELPGIPGVAPPLVAIQGGAPGVLASGWVYEPTFTGGVRVALADVSGDGRADLIAVPGPGRPVEVRVVSGADGSLLQSYLAYGAAFTGGAFVASAEFTRDGRADILVAPDAGVEPSTGMAPPVIGFGGATGAFLGSGHPYGPSFTRGVRIALADINGDGVPDLLTAPGPGTPTLVRVFNLLPTATELESYFAFGPTFAAGAFIAAG